MSQFGTELSTLQNEVVGVRRFVESMQSPGRCWFVVAPVLYSKSVRFSIRVGLVRKNLA